MLCGRTCTQWGLCGADRRIEKGLWLQGMLIPSRRDTLSSALRPAAELFFYFTAGPSDGKTLGVDTTIVLPLSLSLSLSFAVLESIWSMSSSAVMEACQVVPLLRASHLSTFINTVWMRRASLALCMEPRG